MSRRSGAVVLFLVVFMFSTARFASSAEYKTAVVASAEKQDIEKLIDAVENLGGAVFVRNGKEYPPSAAAKFLRGKWRKHAAHIRTAEDFIRIVASKSSTTGRVYVVRFTDGREMTTEAFLRGQLQSLR
jgi:hypothetical protein